MWISFQKKLLPALLLTSLGLLLVLAACGGSSSQTQKKPPTPTPTPTLAPAANSSQAQTLLQKVGKNLITARTLHGIFKLRIEGQLLNGNLASEIWNASPNKNRTRVISSTVSQFPPNLLTVTNGKQAWQYDPAKKVVYTGPVNTNPSISSSNSAQVGGQSQLILGILQTVFTRSKATIAADNVPLNGAITTDIHVISQSSDQANATPGPGGSFQYTGDVYINKANQKPLRIDLGINGLGQIQIDLPSIEVNPTLPASLFTFVPPAGTKVLPLQQANGNNSSGRISFIQAQQQAGYHLLSIPGTQTTYELNGVDALGSPGNQIYTLNYNQGNQLFTVVEGRSLANLPGNGEQINLRGITATFASNNGTGTLAWTEKGVGIRISGKLSKDQLLAIANLLS